MRTWNDFADNPYLQGNYAPIEDELTADTLEVEGEIPEGLRGTYLRIGPNQVFPPPGDYHIFDGDGMLHALTIGEGGRPRYRNRWVRTRGLEYERSVDKAVFYGLSEMRFPDEEVVQGVGPFKNVANTNTVRAGGRLLALWEGGLPTEITDDLDTVGEYNFGGDYRGTFTAHPHIDPVTGDVVVFGYSPFPPYLRYHVIDAFGKVIHTEVIDIPNPVMMHDFMITEGHTVFVDDPAIFDIAGGMEGGPTVRWEPEAGSRIGIVPRFGTNDDIVWHEFETGYTFHFMNAWDEGDKVVLLGERFDELKFGLDPEDRAAPIESVFNRWTIDTKSGAIGRETIDSRTTVFPRIDERRTGRKNRYGHAATFSGDPDMGNFDAVVRWDFESGDNEVWEYGEGCATSEVVFAPDPAGTTETEGWLVSFVYDSSTNSSTFQVLDAGDVSAGPVAKVHLPRRVPFGFHANWFPQEA